MSIFNVDIQDLSVSSVKALSVSSVKALSQAEREVSSPCQGHLHNCQFTIVMYLPVNGRRIPTIRENNCSVVDRSSDREREMCLVQDPEFAEGVDHKLVGYYKPIINITGVDHEVLEPRIPHAPW